MSIESLKKKARRHEQDEQWQGALDQYKKALAELAREDQVDIGLYNRVGDLYVRIGNLDAAVEHYDKAVDLYGEAYLPNNAIAVCKKIIRNVPDRHQAFLRIGQIRAEQGFLPEARTHFLTYAERMQQAGDLDESFRALIEFCDLAPDDVGVRITVAEQMVANGRTEEAIEQFLVARQHFTQNGDQSQAKEVENKILALDPEADLSAASGLVDAFAGSSIGEDGEIVADFGEMSSGGEADDFGSREEAEEEVVGAGIGGRAEGESGSDEDSTAFEISSGDAAFGVTPTDFEAEEGEEEAIELPMMDFGDEAEAEEEDTVELPTLGFGDAAEEEEDTVEMATPGFADEAEEGEAGLVDLGLVDVPADASEAVEEAVEEAAADDFVEDVATVGGAAEEAFGEPAGVEAPEPAGVEAADEASTESDGPATDGGYVDLGAMILGGEEEKSTRFTVEYEEPSGDEDADFAKMLSQFKEKVSKNLDSDDVRAHHDLGTAYKEMGLLDEAISSFQAVLRTSADHLPTYELMGQTFIEMGQNEAAVKSLERALDVETSVEDELVGIYYYLARAYEGLQDKDSAVEYYGRVFSLDINFADVTERLRELR